MVVVADVQKRTTRAGEVRWDVRGQETFEEWAQRWMDTLGNRKPKTRETHESIVHRDLLPRFANTPIVAID